MLDKVFSEAIESIALSFPYMEVFQLVLDSTSPRGGRRLEATEIFDCTYQLRAEE